MKEGREGGRESGRKVGSKEDKKIKLLCKHLAGSEK
jgi:hypothetical protein